MVDDYIRREDAVNIAESYEVKIDGFCLDDYEYGRDQVARSIANDLEDIAAADVVPVRHGKWISDVFCSECGWINEVEPGFIGGTKGFNFCPNCGADMRGDEHD